MAAVSSQGIGLDSEMGRKTRWKARRMKLCSLGAIPGRLGAIPMLLLMYTSNFPLSSGGNSTNKLLAVAKGTFCGIVLGWGICGWSGACISNGSHPLQCRMLVARLATVSEIYPHSLRQGFLPNVRRR